MRFLLNSKPITGCKKIDDNLLQLGTYNFEDIHNFDSEDCFKIVSLKHALLSRSIKSIENSFFRIQSYVRYYLFFSAIKSNNKFYRNP